MVAVAHQRATRARRGSGRGGLLTPDDAHGWREAALKRLRDDGLLHGLPLA